MQQLEVSSHSETLLGYLGDKLSKILGCQQYRVNPDSVLCDQWGFPFPAGGTPPPCKSQALSALHSWLSQRALINNQHPNPSTHVDLRSSHWQSCSHTPFKESKTQKVSISCRQHTFMGSQHALMVGPRASWPPHVLSGDNKN